MTLNITLAAPWGIHQCSDFRLIDANNQTLVHDASPKLVVLTYTAWNGMVSCRGVGKFGNDDTFIELGKWLTHPVGERGIEEVLAIIESEGSRWLTGMPRRYPHTFVVGRLLARNQG